MANIINYSPRLPKLFKDLGMDTYKSLFVVDVGASGGIHDRWDLFGEKLEAIGFDPLTSEVERLNKLNVNPKIKYEEGFIVYKDLDKHYPIEQRNEASAYFNSFAKSSAVRASQAKNYNYAQEHFNAGKALVYSEKFFEIDDYVKENNISDIDFIKIDTDGHDFPVLLGSEKTLDNCSVLGLEVEAQFHGEPHPYANTFSNIDQFLRSKGFTLFNLDSYFYSRGALPAEFLYTILAQTVTGHIQWGEALYFRDLADKNYSQKFNFPITLDKVIKLACLFELHGLNDCAADLLINRAEEFGFTKHLDVLLDALTPSFRGRQLTYKEYIKRFDENPKEWFPSIEGKINERLFGDASGKRGILIKLLSCGYKLLKKFK
jgi:FkbM family methyltransferase